jgi:hypothetical protein
MSKVRGQVRQACLCWQKSAVSMALRSFHLPLLGKVSGELGAIRSIPTGNGDLSTRVLAQMIQHIL